MIKNQANIFPFVLRDSIGQGIENLSPSVQIRKDSGSFTSTTNTPTEVGDGLYEVSLTAAECNCNVMAIKVYLPDGQFPAILSSITLDAPVDSRLAVIQALLDNWDVDGTTLTCYDSNGSVLETCTLTKDSNDEIIAVTPDE